MKSSAATSPNPTLAPLKMRFDLGHLPTSQHRAGLAGLIMVVEWLKRQPSTTESVCDIEVDETGATFYCDQAGLTRLYDDIYAASIEEYEVDVPYKDAKKNIKPPIRTVERELKDKQGIVVKDKQGDPKMKTRYVYSKTVPKGSFLADESLPGGAIWLKLWRDAMWQVIRSQRTHGPYDKRAKGEGAGDAAEMWEILLKNADRADGMTGTDLIGMQANNPEGISLKDTNRNLFLLQFWPFAIQIFRMEVIDHEGKPKRELASFVLVFPDVSNLRGFCSVWRSDVLGNRRDKAKSFYPADSFISMPVEGAFKTYRLLYRKLIERTSPLDGYVIALDVICLRLEGHSIKTLDTARIDTTYLGDYLRIADRYTHPTFFKQRLLNLLADKPWYYRFDRIFEQQIRNGEDWERNFNWKAFVNDAKTAFRTEDYNMQIEAVPLESTDEALDEATSEKRVFVPEKLSAIVFMVVQAYLKQRVQRKFGLKNGDARIWTEVHKEAESLTYRARACRSERHFQRFFAETFHSERWFIGHHDNWTLLTDSLQTDAENVRNLTLVALSGNR